ncbi:uncharacterized protein M421DRAFT_363951 [Didymella exigua CBS 183.55]|uniref:Uncharacterized protein n=1 Tax=Didymella exigua CBS 183.55 TaxID=1150837 RepID=A0A6A5RT38_9PLEO|nr:uncharacterized protein M421DRAFT_363951 [Didymella exigua CBS 183.55]KAF1931002.1 hypothetical protein M421DRAFT_363951 [Didymella exigua CBS 183.55]
MTKLCSLFQDLRDGDKLTSLIQDARRFLMYHKGAIEGYPLQSYASALLFSPIGSQTRQLFKHEEPKGITIRPASSDKWSACLQTLEGHSDTVRSVAFSRDSTRLASGTGDGALRIWDASSGVCLQTLEIGHTPFNLSFDSTGSILYTEMGTIALQGGEDLSFGSTGSVLYTEIGTIALRSREGFTAKETIELTRSQFVSTSLSSDRKWITHKGKNVLWIPSEYRPSCSSVSGNIVGTGVSSGRVWFCTADL